MNINNKISNIFECGAEVIIDKNKCNITLKYNSFDEDCNWENIVTLENLKMVNSELKGKKLKIVKSETELSGQSFLHCFLFTIEL